MTRRKSVYLKWTLVLLLVIVCPLVHTRPQETNSSVKVDVSTENTIRYFNNNISVSNVPKVISLEGNHSVNNNFNIFYTQNNRTSRLIKSKTKNKNNHNSVNKPKPTKEFPQTKNRKGPPIRKVVTKWKDEAKVEDFDFHETNSKEGEITTNEHLSIETTESIKEAEQKQQYPYYPHNYMPQVSYIPQQYPQYPIRPQYPNEPTQVYSSNIQIVDTHTYPPHPIYTFTRPPSPTPIITNVGYPTPWYQNPQIFTKPTTKKPVHVTKPLNYNYHNSIHNYPGGFEVTTFPPTSAHTERIVIRPEEYSGSPDECPTIFLTLNNTFQGQAKEACPDLNIAVNTNVINKNNVVESEEDDGDGFFPNTFGLPLDDDSNSDDSAAANDYGEGESEQAESASVEGTELANYHAAQVVEDSEEPGQSASPSSQLSALTRPSRPNKDDDDFFGFSSLTSYFKPAMGALAWLASINPFTIGLFPLFLTPLAFLFAGSSLATLFSPWFLPIGREAPAKVQVHRPYWHWDDTIKTWHLHSYPDNRRLRSSRNSKETGNAGSSIKPTLFYRLKELLKLTTNVINGRINKPSILVTNRKNKRKKK